MRANTVASLTSTIMYDDHECGYETTALDLSEIDLEMPDLFLVHQSESEPHKSVCTRVFAPASRYIVPDLPSSSREPISVLSSTSWGEYGVWTASAGCFTGRKLRLTVGRRDFMLFYEPAVATYNTSSIQ